MPVSSSFRSALKHQYEEAYIYGMYQHAEWLIEFIDGDIELKTLNLYKHHQAARLAFDQREYRRAASIIGPETTALGAFLRIHSLYKAIETDLQAKKIPECSPAEFVPIHNQELESLKKDLDDVLEHVEYSFFTWIHSKILTLMKRPASVINEMLVEALIKDPQDWILWDALQVSTEAELMALKARLPPTEFWYNYFMIKNLLALGRDASKYIVKIKKTGPKVIVDQFEAINAANCRQFELASSLFKTYFSSNPATLQHVHVYSNVLFVLGNYPELATLASRCVALDRFSAETCCVLGNLWSLMGKHEQAVISFKRALRMNPKMPSVWVLVGHEYVELRNPSAAITAYLKGTEANPSDYRAWFGLGQVYDLLGSPAQAADYYRRAVNLNPRDGRIWAALGMVFESEEMFEHAIDSYRNALACPNTDRKLFFRIGSVLAEIGLESESIEAYYEFLGTRFDLDKVSLDEEEKAQSVLRIAEYLISTNPTEAIQLLKHLSTVQSDIGKRAMELLALCDTSLL